MNVIAESRVVFDIIARDKASAAFKSAGRGADGLKSQLGSMAKFAAGAFAGIGVASFAKSVIDAGSDLQETISKTNTIFGQSSVAIQQWASSAARNFGLSRQAALDAVSGFGNMFSQLGIGSEQARLMSTAMVELAADIASFHNVAGGAAAVADAMASAFRGEYDALQRYIPTITAAAVEHEALAQTGKRAASELTAAEKAIAVQTLVMQGAGAAAGDFARTSDSLANRQRQLQATFANLRAELGTKLLPIMERVSAWMLNTGIPLIDRFRSGWYKFTLGLQEVGRIWNDLIARFQSGWAKLENGAKQWAAFFKAIRDAIDKTLGPVDEILGKLLKVANAGGGLLGTIVGAAKNVSNPIGSVLRRQHGGPVSAFQPYVVGEAGPELFIPRTSGTVVSNNELGSRGTTVTLAPGAVVVNNPTRESSDASIAYELRKLSLLGMLS